jgi:hypothetical protein
MIAPEANDGKGLHSASDPARIDQVLTNLLTNATRHTNAGTVTLKLHLHELDVMALPGPRFADTQRFHRSTSAGYEGVEGW